MSRDDVDCVWLQRTDSGLVAQLAFGDYEQLPRRLVEPCEVLSAVINHVDVCDRIQLSVSPEHMRALHRFVMCPKLADWFDNHMLVFVAQVCLFLETSQISFPERPSR